MFFFLLHTFGAKLIIRMLVVQKAASEFRIMLCGTEIYHHKIVAFMQLETCMNDCANTSRCWGISNQIFISVPSYLDDVQSVICYHYTSVSCYAIVYNGCGDSGIQRGRYSGLNYALCLETTPRQRLTIHPDDRELQC